MHSSVVRALIVVVAMGCAADASADTPHKEFTPDVVVNPNAYYPEGPQLIDEGLLVAEMPRHRIVLIGKGGERKTVWQADGCGPTSVKQIPGGGYWVLCHLAGYVAKLSPTFQTVQTFQQTTSGRRISWPNDASVDSSGNLYLSSSGLFSLQAPAEGRVVFIDVATGTASDIASGIRYSNGVLVQERQKRVLVSEHLNRRMLAFPLLDKGKLGPSTIFFDFKSAPAAPDAYEQSGPDGIAAFADGDIAVADYGNGRILLLSGGGKFLTQIPLKYRFVTNLAIARDQRTIFVTMTRDNSSPELDGVVQAFKVTSGKE
ncbi:MAG: SMP-30/gluconolactonase/LRE family protein [Betaproteobacteria bacterium]|nr:MAG: SMP-30/gluconolactonase/LRE family protein [Betaproteobacteria bacterium]